MERTSVYDDLTLALRQQEQSNHEQANRTRLLDPRSWSTAIPKPLPPTWLGAPPQAFTLLKNNLITRVRRASFVSTHQVASLPSALELILELTLFGYPQQFLRALLFSLPRVPACIGARRTYRAWVRIMGKGDRFQGGAAGGGPAAWGERLGRRPESQPAPAGWLVLRAGSARA